MLCHEPRGAARRNIPAWSPLLGLVKCTADEALGHLKYIIISSIIQGKHQEGQLYGGPKARERIRCMDRRKEASQSYRRESRKHSVKRRAKYLSSSSMTGGNLIINIYLTILYVD